MVRQFIIRDSENSIKAPLTTNIGSISHCADQEISMLMQENARQIRPINTSTKDT